MNIKLLEKLCNESGISGDENRVRDIILEEIKPYITSYEIDKLGNLLVFKKGQYKANKRVLLSAHMDEVGFIVTNITSDGMIKFAPVGGIDKSVVASVRVKIGDNNIYGVVNTPPIHLLDDEEKKKLQSIDSMCIDIGANSKEEVLEYVNLGDSITFDSPFIADGKNVFAKALDDRIGCLVLIDIIKNQTKYDMYYSFVVQEEVGLRGAKVGTYNINPDSAIVVEATTAADTPRCSKENNVCELSGGAVVAFMDKSTIYNREYVKLALEVAKKNNVKIQIKKAVAGGNDSGAIHCSRSGVSTLAVSFPCRYLHSATCLISEEDYQSVFTVVSKTAEIIAGEKND